MLLSFIFLIRENNIDSNREQNVRKEKILWEQSL